MLGKKDKAKVSEKSSGDINAFRSKRLV